MSSTRYGKGALWQKSSHMIDPWASFGAHSAKAWRSVINVPTKATRDTSSMNEDKLSHSTVRVYSQMECRER